MTDLLTDIREASRFVSEHRLPELRLEVGQAFADGLSDIAKAVCPPGTARHVGDPAPLASVAGIPVTVTDLVPTELAVLLRGGHVAAVYRLDAVHPDAPAKAPKRLRVVK